ncbi:hypothetical protein HA466_0023940 [Hirschfeldia incana]|nr:hypothetical protein HA466_0023940 [Hirschfeldia incana]
MSSVSPSSQLVQVVPDSNKNTDHSSAKVEYEDLVRTDELQIGSVVDGLIDGKFEGGYHCAKRPKCHPQETMKAPPSGMPPASQRRPKKKARVKTIVVDSPKHICQRSGYNFFFPGHYDWLKPEYHGKERIITKMIGRTCGNLSESEKQVYQDRGVKDVERYRTVMLEDKSVHEGGASASAASTVAK